MNSITNSSVSLEGFERLEAFVVDLNGVPRGKWLSPAKLPEYQKSGFPMPRSLFAQDIWGSDVEAAGLAFGTGDPDGPCFPIMSSLCPVPWAATPSVQVICSMRESNGSGYFIDPRAILERATSRLTGMGLTPVTAVELEFYLLADKPGGPRPLRLPQPGDSENPITAGNVLSMDILAEHETFLDEVLRSARAMSLPVDTVLHENSPGQFEINLLHGPDPCLAADQAILLKRCIKGVAKRHGMRACFMAKPFGELAGSGMHVHTSLLGRDGAFFFADSDGGPAPTIFNAIGGMLASLPDMMLIFAPHANSYRRFHRNSHAPMTAGWAWGDRSAAVRAIDGKPSALRIEHRVAGADANPYLVLASILNAIADGLEQQIDPGEAQKGTPTSAREARLPLDWRSAIERFEDSTIAADQFGERARDVIAACKWQDFDGLLLRVPPAEYETYLGTV